MLINIYHETSYTYPAAPSYLLQRLQLEPIDFASQHTKSWSITAPGIEKGLSYVDGFGNRNHLVTMRGQAGEVKIIAQGEVETQDASGMVRGLTQTVPDAVFLRHTDKTMASKAMVDLAEALKGNGEPLQLAHDIMLKVFGSIAYVAGVSNTQTTAAEAFAAKCGVCQDHAHIMVAMARYLVIPARYVTGYLVTGIGASSTAAHAWTELLIPKLGWIGFDPANGQCPTDHYVRVASGLDATSVAPVRGIRRGGSSDENMRVEVRVEIAQQ
jgi:transglutaminase-like putative cysteine protease